jgi:hypothetical protein
MAAFVVLLSVAPPPTSLPAYAAVTGAMGQIATWIFFPSLTATLVAGLLAIAANPAFMDIGWVWIKAATGILVFEGGLVHIQGPIQEEAKRSASALAGRLDPAALTGAFGGLRNTLWVLLAVATANVVLGVWRPRFYRAER